MKKMIILAASLMIFAGTAVSCGKSGGSSSESDTSSSSDVSSSSEASSGKYTFEEAKKRAGKSVRKKAAEALESTTVPPKKIKEDAECDPEAEKAVRDFIEVMYTDSDVENTLKYLYPEAIYTELIGTDAEKNFGEGGSEEIEISDINIDSCEMLSADPWLETIRLYFEMTARSNGIELDTPIIVTKACEADVTFNVAVNGTANEVNVTVIAVNVSGEGWKLIPLESEKLAEVIEDTKDITWE